MTIKVHDELVEIDRRNHVPEPHDHNHLYQKHYRIEGIATSYHHTSGHGQGVPVPQIEVSVVYLLGVHGQLNVITREII